MHRACKDGLDLTSSEKLSKLKNISSPARFSKGSSKTTSWLRTNREGQLWVDLRTGNAALVCDERQAVLLSPPFSQVCNYEVCVFSSFHRTGQGNITERGWLLSNGTGGSLYEQMFSRPQTHLQNPDLKKGWREGGSGGIIDGRIGQCWQQFKEDMIKGVDTAGQPTAMALVYSFSSFVLHM